MSVSFIVKLCIRVDDAECRWVAPTVDVNGMFDLVASQVDRFSGVARNRRIVFRV